MSYLCDVCNRIFATINGLQYHVKNKVCEKYKCIKCDTYYANSTTYKYHLLHNVCDKKIISKPKPKIQLKPIQPQSMLLQSTINDDELYDNFNNLTFEEYKKLCEERLTLKTHIVQPTQINIANIGNMANINIDKLQYNNNIINVPPAFLSMDTYEHIMKRCPTALDQAVFKTPTDCIVNLTKLTNCNPDYPEFNSIMITNKRDGTAKISDGKKFKLVSRENVITKLIDNKRLLIQRHIDNYPEKYAKISKKLEKYMDIIEDEDQYKALVTELVYELIAMKDVINSDKWKSDLDAFIESNKSTDIVHI